MRLLFHKKKNQTENAPVPPGKWDSRQDGKTFTQEGVQGAASRVAGPSRERPVIDKPPEIRYSIADSQGGQRPRRLRIENVCTQNRLPPVERRYGMKSVTLKDVARAAGVSYSTVSRALSGSPQIGRDTRERLLRLCDEMGYTKNYVARSMVMRKTELIGLVVPSIDNPFMAELAYHAEMSARARGYNIMLCSSGPDLRQEKTAVKLLAGRQVDGMLIVPQEHQSCEALRPYTEQVPTVFLSEDLRDAPLSCVTTDNAGGAYLAMEYLYSLGHREILYFGRRSSVTHQLRAEGYLRACRDMGLTPRIVDNAQSGSSVAVGCQLGRELFEKPLDYTAVLASTDSNALGLLRAADERGIRIPEQLSLVGFDNISAASMPRIDLTTVEQPKRDMALQAVEILLDKIERGTQGYVHQVLLPSLVRRGSCRPLTAAGAAADGQP